MKRVRLLPVDDAGHPVYRLVDELGVSMRCGLFVDRDSAARYCRARGWVLLAVLFGVAA